MFDITGKVALVTGGASGIGFQIVKELFRNGLRACTIADVNETFGQDAVDTISNEFGPDKVIFVKTDVVDKAQYEAAFKATIEKFKNIDILVNNAGIMNDAIWEQQILINVQGTINGIILGMENYLQKHRSGSEAVILNLGSIVSVDVFNCTPIYTATKHAVLGLTRSFGAPQHYERTKVKVVQICPGLTNTPLIAPEIVPKKLLGPAYLAVLRDDIEHEPRNSPEYVGKAANLIIKNGAPRSVWVAEGDEPPYELHFPKRQELRKDLLK